MHCNSPPEHAESEGRERIPSFGTPALFNAVESSLCFSLPGPCRASALVLCCVFGIRRWQEQRRLIPVMPTANVFPASGHTFPLHRSGRGQIFIVYFILFYFFSPPPPICTTKHPTVVAAALLSEDGTAASHKPVPLSQLAAVAAGSRRGARAVHNLPMQGKAGGAGGLSWSIRN